MLCGVRVGEEEMETLSDSLPDSTGVTGHGTPRNAALPTRPRPPRDPSAAPSSASFVQRQRWSHHPCSYNPPLTPHPPTQLSDRFLFTHPPHFPSPRPDPRFSLSSFLRVLLKSARGSSVRREVALRLCLQSNVRTVFVLQKLLPADSSLPLMFSLLLTSSSVLPSTPPPLPASPLEAAVLCRVLLVFQPVLVGVRLQATALPPPPHRFTER